MKLTHPDAPKRVVEPDPEHAEMYQSQGWVVAPAPKVEKPAAKPADPEK